MSARRISATASVRSSAFPGFVLCCLGTTCNGLRFSPAVAQLGAEILLHNARRVIELTGLLVLLLPVLGSAAAARQDPDAVLRGEYVFHAGACDSCHTNHPQHGAFLAGGRRMDTQFGTFYVPNITPDVATGIGGSSAEDFRRAMIEGETPAGSHYYPVFPYRWY